VRWVITPSTIGGSLNVPGDKSIAHRALMLAALARGSSRIRGLPSGEDVLATAACLRALGVQIETKDENTAVCSEGNLESAVCLLDAANSGTTIRLLTGILAGQSFRSNITGDDSLRRRPMNRVVSPLALMGAEITSCDGFPPLEIEPSQLHSIRYTLPVASAQVKSAILLAGLFAQGSTTVVEPIATRDHTERMLSALGVDIDITGNSISVEGGQRPRSFELDVPGDPSSAAFFFAAGLLTGGEVEVCNMLTNPTRTGFLDAVGRMGAQVEVRNLRDQMGEPVADVRVSGPASKPVEIGGSEVPILVDEIPLIALLATQARGVSTITGAQELRVKETDRVARVASILRAMGADVRELPDGFCIRGPTPLSGTSAASAGDHRMAMMLAIAGTAASGATLVEDASVASVSYPGFDIAFRQMGAAVEAA
jgi:3-phosphoshikimate 1-carboxyvinyltransferase